MRYLMCLIILVCVGCSSCANKKDEVVKRTVTQNQDATVTVVVGKYQSSGVVTKIDDKVVVVTTNHSTEKAPEIKKKIDDDLPVYLTEKHCLIVYTVKVNGIIVSIDTTDGVLVYSSPELDISIILPEKLPSGVFPIVFSMKRPEVGTRIYAIGSPRGVIGAGTVSAGIISRYISFGYNFILCQIDAIVYTGSSGSGVFGPDGECIGIILMKDGESDNFGYYLPSDIILANIAKNKKLIFSKIE